jgi:type VI secretion system lysozyme-like protein
MSTIVAATHIPLFDRITGFSEASFDGRLMDAHGLRLSLLRDLGRLFNARNGLTIEAFLASEPSVLDYGLPDLLSLSPRSRVDLDQVAQVVKHGITLYEPRLSHVEVKADLDTARHNAARVTIAAAVNTGEQLCRVDFDVVMDSRAAEVRESG